MSFIAVRSLPLSAESKEAWREVGGIYPAHERTTQEIISLAMRREAQFILNLGKSSFNPNTETIPVINMGEDIYPLLWPGMTRELLGDLMPPQPTEFPCDVWIKAPGRAGRGKFRKQVYGDLKLPRLWDWQRHIEGQEFRIITVGGHIVQQFKRFGPNGARTYEWLAQSELSTGAKQAVKLAAARLHGMNVIAWDLIQGEDRVGIFEGNSCPGMSVNTASRIVAEIENQLEHDYA